MLREHAPLIAVSAVVAVMFYLVFRDLRGLHAELETVMRSSPSMGLEEDTRPAPPGASTAATLATAANDATEVPGETAPPVAKRRA